MPDREPQELDAPACLPGCELDYPHRTCARMIQRPPSDPMPNDPNSQSPTSSSQISSSGESEPDARRAKADNARLRADLAEAVEALRELVAVRDSDRIDSDLSIDEWVRRLAAFSDRHDAAYDAARAFLARLDSQPTEGAGHG